MSILIFIIILAVLIFVHELGHFLIAKKSGIRVDEFAIGFPPRLFSFVKGGTRYALNLIPFGGYVKIFGETPDEESTNSDAEDSFVNKPRSIQAAVLFGGILFNILFAWILLSISLMSGFPAPVSYERAGIVENARVVVTGVAENSPAENAGLLPGDAIISLEVDPTSSFMLSGDFSVADVQDFIATHQNEVIDLTIIRGDEQVRIDDVSPMEGIFGDRKMIGISMDMIGTVQLPIHRALVEGFMMTGSMIRDIALGLASLVSDSVSGDADLTTVAGPVGIVGLVDDASSFGLSYLLGFTAFISINLAVINLVPFPALDGGRLLFVLIEAITRRQIPVKVANTLNLIGFLLLIGLLIFLTFHDVARLL